MSASAFGVNGQVPRSFLGLEPSTAADLGVMPPWFTGYKTWSYNPQENFPGTNSLTSGYVWAVRVPWASGENATSVVVPIPTAGTGMTYAGVGLYTPDGSTQLCATGDLSSVWTSAGVHESAFTSAETITEDEVIMAILSVGGTSPVAYRGQTAGGIGGTWVNYGAGSTPLVGFQSGQSSLPASLSLSVSVNTFWMGVR